MLTLDKALLIGHLTRDPEHRVTPTGMTVARFAIAINRSFTVKGEKREETVYIDIEAFGPTAEAICKYFTKGRPIYIEGRHKLNQWEDKQTGQTRNRLSIVAERWSFVDSPPGRDRTDDDHRAQRPQQSQPAQKHATDEDGDDIPF